MAGASKFRPRRHRFGRSLQLLPRRDNIAHHVVHLWAAAACADEWKTLRLARLVAIQLFLGGGEDGSGDTTAGSDDGVHIEGYIYIN